MLEPLNRGKIKNFDPLGFFNPFWFKYEECLFIEPKFSRIVEKCLEANKLVIDPVGVLEILSRRFCFSDRTLVRGISASPWMSRPNKAGDGWEYIQPPEHGELRLPPAFRGKRSLSLL